MDNQLEHVLHLEKLAELCDEECPGALWARYVHGGVARLRGHYMRVGYASLLLDLKSLPY